jgi:hypothetical protein
LATKWLVRANPTWYIAGNEGEGMATQNHIHRLHAQGERLYQQLRKKIEPRYKGQIIAIEAESGQYVVGKDELQVAQAAMKKFPGKKFNFFRVGYPAVHKLRTRTC